MWELIRANRRKSIFLFVLMGILYLIMGMVIGAVFDPTNGAVAGAIIAFILWLVLAVVSYTQGDNILLALSGAKEVTPDVHPQLFNVVEEMKIAAGLPGMPRVYIIPDEASNAFAVGRDPRRCAVAVTAGLLARLNRDELQGVVAHEIGHIQNRDILFLTFAGVMLGTIVIVSEIFLRGLRVGASGARFRRGGRGGGQAQLAFIVIALVFAILAPIIARLLYFAISRRREYLADATGARLTRYPEGLASALEKISAVPHRPAQVSRITAPMYIANPMDGSMFASVMSTHPPISERVKILRGMGQGAGFVDYQRAYAKATSSGSLLPASALKDKSAVAVRAASPGQEAPRTGRQQKRDLGDLVRAMNQFAFIACACGLTMKIPPDFKKPTLACPRCNRVHQVPLAELIAAGAVLSAAGVGGVAAPAAASASRPAPPSGPFTYQRRGKGWETFTCAQCGRPLQISPSLAAPSLICRACNSVTNIRGGN
ncbi:MAG: M48 family metallopeptidase [Planctomycetota bacterium]